MPAAVRGAALSRARSRRIETPSGPARAVVAGHGRPDLAVIGHGAGGGIEAPDLIAVTERLDDLGWTVARVEQPYRVKGRRAPEAAPRLDAAWCAVVTALRAEHPGRLLVAGRSSGARVAVRTAAELAADLIVALAFPLHPPGKPDKTRAQELAQLPAPMLIVQGERDPFGAPAEFPAGPRLTPVPGDHSLRQVPDQVAAAVADWLAGIGR